MNWKISLPPWRRLVPNVRARSEPRSAWNSFAWRFAGFSSCPTGSWSMRRHPGSNPIGDVEGPTVTSGWQSPPPTSVAFAPRAPSPRPSQSPETLTRSPRMPMGTSGPHWTEPTRRSSSIPPAEPDSPATRHTSSPIPRGFGRARQSIWFAQYGANVIGGITPEPSPIPSARRPGRKTSWPDRRNLWVTDSATNQIAGSAPMAWASLLRPPHELSSPWAITAGPDGNLWFTESGRGQDRPDHDQRSDHRVLRWAPASRARRGSSRAPTVNIWFTESGASILGRISRAGLLASITTLALPTATCAAR